MNKHFHIISRQTNAFLGMASRRNVLTRLNAEAPSALLTKIAIKQSAKQFSVSVVRPFAKKMDENSEMDKKMMDGVLDEISRSVEEELAKAKQGQQTELGKSFMNFQIKNQQESIKSVTFVTWKTITVLVIAFVPLLVILFVVKKMKDDEKEKNRKKTIGKARLGGEWELVNVEGKTESSRDLLGKWVLIYFGFTNCPDICPDEIEKMIDVVDILHREEATIPIEPIFISVDPERDTAQRIRVYCAEFSPKLRGFTGSKEQIAKVAKAFRVYHSEGPRTKRTDDYIVDHTVIMYLIDPDGNFHDYYGQNRRARDIANVIKIKAIEWDAKKRREQFWLNKILRGSNEEEKTESNVTAKAIS